MTLFWDYLCFDISKDAVYRFGGYRAKFLKIPFLSVGILIYKKDQPIMNLFHGEGIATKIIQNDVVHHD